MAQWGDGQKALAACVALPTSSAMCSLGTKGCQVEHDVPPYTEEAVHPDDPIAHGRRWRKERDQYRQAALELNAEIRHAIAWTGSGGPRHVADAMLLKTAEKWRELLEDE